MPGFVWKRTHTIVAAAAVVALGGGAAAVALQPEEPAAAPLPVSTPSPKPTARPAPRVTTAPAPEKKPKPEPADPLTGRDPSRHGVLAVKVENIAAARPQAGLADADIVFVEEVEGRLTRLVAVYHSTFPKRVGPVRSARNTDVQLLPLFGRPGLVYSGANSMVQRNIDRASIKPLPRSTRDSSRVAPHNVFVDLAGVARSTKLRMPDSIGWTFGAANGPWSKAARDRLPAGRVGGDRMSFPYADGHYTVLWNGRAYDGGRRARTENVVVLDTVTRPDGNADVNGARSVRSMTVGSGKVAVYRDGRKVTGRWHRSAAGKPMRLTAGQRDIPLRPGRTWVLLR